MGTPTVYKFRGGQKSIYTGFLLPNLCYGEYIWYTLKQISWNQVLGAWYYVRDHSRLSNFRM